jgi:hypothetical protein
MIQNENSSGISPESFLKLGIHLYETQKTIDENNQDVNDILNEEQEILKDTIIELKKQRHYINNEINKLLNENTEITKKIHVFDYENKLNNINNINKSMSSSSYNIIYLETDNIKNLIIEYLNKQTKNNMTINELNVNLDAIDESILCIERKIIK